MTVHQVEDHFVAWLNFITTTIDTERDCLMQIVTRVLIMSCPFHMMHSDSNTGGADIRLSQLNFKRYLPI